MLSIPGELWSTYAKNDRRNPELVFPPDGVAMPFEDAVDHYVPKSIQDRLGDEESFKAQFARCQVALDTLRDTLAEAKPDITIIITDDQGHGDLGVHGNAQIKTPTIDKFAKQIGLGFPGGARVDRTHRAGAASLTTRPRSSVTT